MIRKKLDEETSIGHSFCQVSGLAFLLKEKPFGGHRLFALHKAML